MRGGGKSPRGVHLHATPRSRRPPTSTWSSRPCGGRHRNRSSHRRSSADRQVTIRGDGPDLGNLFGGRRLLRAALEVLHQRGHGEVDAAIAIRLGTHHIWDELITQRKPGPRYSGKCATAAPAANVQTFTARDASPVYFAWDTGAGCCAWSRPYTSSRKCTVPSLLAQPSR